VPTRSVQDASLHPEVKSSLIKKGPVFPLHAHTYTRTRARAHTQIQTHPWISSNDSRRKGWSSALPLLRPEVRNVLGDCQRKAQSKERKARASTSEKATMVGGACGREHKKGQRQINKEERERGARRQYLLQVWCATRLVPPSIFGALLQVQRKKGTRIRHQARTWALMHAPSLLWSAACVQQACRWFSVGSAASVWRAPRISVRVDTEIVKGKMRTRGQTAACCRRAWPGGTYPIAGCHQRSVFDAVVHEAAARCYDIAIAARRLSWAAARCDNIAIAARRLSWQRQRPNPGVPCTHGRVCCPPDVGLRLRRHGRRLRAVLPLGRQLPIGQRAYCVRLEHELVLVHLTFLLHLAQRERLHHACTAAHHHHQPTVNLPRLFRSPPEWAMLRSRPPAPPAPRTYVRAAACAVPPRKKWLKFGHCQTLGCGSYADFGWFGT